jgi:hypothetical protein
MTQTRFSRFRALKTGLSLACFLVAATAWSQVAPGSGDVSFNIGYDHFSSLNGFAWGGAGETALTQYVAIGAEFNDYRVSQNMSGVNGALHLIDYGALGRFNLVPNSKVVPYGLCALGGSHASVSASSGGITASASAGNGYYLGFGGGASIYLSPNWGVRAELRDNWNHISGSGINAFAMTGGIFYQFGGHKKKI